MRNYVIAAPPYSKSAGVRALYALSDLLETRGFQAPVLCHEACTEHHCISSFTREMQEEDIVIYPEIVRGNPLRFRRVVRYVLYFPGRLGGTRCFDDNEYVVTWDKEYIKGVPELTLPLLDRTLFYDAGLPRTHDAIYEHKSCGEKRALDIPKGVHITMHYPERKQDLVFLLQTTRTLYSYDHNSLLNNEAAACGARVKLVTDEGIVDYEPVLNFDENKFRRQLDAFIEDTQALLPHKPRSVPCLRGERLMWYFRLLFHRAAYACTGREENLRRTLYYKIKLGIPVK